MSSLLESINEGRKLGKIALYFGCWGQPGHYWHDTKGRHLWDKLPEDFPNVWKKLADSGLLCNGKHEDAYDGKVWWTCGGSNTFWYAFYWWDNSGDHRGASNSGFYVRGFDWPESQLAFDYACGEFPSIVSRQKFPLVLQK